MSKEGRWTRPVHSVLARGAGGSAVGRMLGILTIALVVLLLLSCGGEPRPIGPTNLSPEDTMKISAVPEATPRSKVNPQIGQIIWTAAIDSSTNAPTEPVSSYLADAPQIIATVLVQSIPAGARVEATWEYNSTSLDAFTSQLSPTEMIDQTWIAFHIERDSDVLWPVGTYEIRISLEGVTVQEAAIEVTG
jgi:hypothetical protein